MANTSTCALIESLVADPCINSQKCDKLVFSSVLLDWEPSQDLYTDTTVDVVRQLAKNRAKTWEDEAITSDF